MPLNICPSLFFIVPDKNTKPYNENDIFRSDGFTILGAENLTHVKEIVANTSTNQPLQVRLLCCYRMKGLPKNYCLARHVDNAEKQVCNAETGINTDFIHFHIRTNILNGNEYLLAFIEGADFYDNINKLINELFCSVEWLGISAQHIFLNIFTFGEPAFGTRNTNHLDECINAARKQAMPGRMENIEYDITHIRKNFKDGLCISFNKNSLFFNPS